ncbi:MAG: hypothetical protein JWP66_1540 [Naasia sp.]|nr:hypothetical protein [Naasia sp.]
MLTSVIRDDLAALHEAVSRDSILTFTTRGWDEWPEWYQRLLTKLWLLLAGEDVVYMSSNVSDEEGPAGSVVVFTGDRVILGEVGHTLGAATVTTWRRRDIRSVAVEHLTPFTEGHSWPARLRSEVVFEEGFAVILPLAPRPRQAHLRETIELLRLLTRNLAAPS